ncbi:uncharacterized protein [Solanum tuberosum]|uniref:uncharacterized protein n=1 Tax=Solanum tuberosum TaxID=4113 RepID=UPI000739FC5A|nr:PREDICTED: uncharacterized protein LOC107063036 [Solanum tuberosum]
MICALRLFFSLFSSPLRRCSLLCSPTVYYKLLSIGKNGGEGIKLMLRFYMQNPTNSGLRIQNRVENPKTVSNITCEKEYRLHCSSLISSLEPSISGDKCNSLDSYKSITTDGDVHTVACYWDSGPSSVLWHCTTVLA